MSLNRRSFFGALAAVATAPVVAQADIPEAVRFANIDPYVEWRGRTWWVDERARLRWAFTDRTMVERNRPDSDWLAVFPGIRSIAPHDDRLWIRTFDNKWAHFTFRDSPCDESARVVVVSY